MPAVKERICGLGNGQACVSVLEWRLSGPPANRSNEIAVHIHGNGAGAGSSCPHAVCAEWLWGHQVLHSLHPVMVHVCLQQELYVPSLRCTALSEDELNSHGCEICSRRCWCHSLCRHTVLMLCLLVCVPPHPQLGCQS